ncbi:MAG: hypothetical protein AB1757_14960 [Acidobacteriota bacterium]
MPEEFFESGYPRRRAEDEMIETLAQLFARVARARQTLNYRIATASALLS